MAADAREEMILAFALKNHIAVTLVRFIFCLYHLMKDARNILVLLPALIAIEFRQTSKILL